MQAFLEIERSDDILRHIERRCSYKGLHNAIASGQMTTVVKDLKGGQILLRKGEFGNGQIDTPCSKDQEERLWFEPSSVSSHPTSGR